MTALIVLVPEYPCEVPFQALYFRPFLTPKATGNAAGPAGTEGISTPRPAAPTGAVSGWDDQTAPPPAVSPTRQPFYKRRWFIISQIIIIPLGIALLFIVLFPVVRAIVELVVKRTNLSVQLAVITQPVNNS